MIRGVREPRFDCIMQDDPVAARSKASVYGRSLFGIAGSNIAGGMDVFCYGFCVLSGKGLCDEMITRPKES